MKRFVCPPALSQRRSSFLRLLVALFVALVCSQTGLNPVAARMPFEAGSTPTLAPMLDVVTPAVVNISVVARVPAEQNPLLRDPFFRRFFNIPEGMPETRPRASAGSGVIVDAARGLVLTNSHVIANAIEVSVTLKDQRRYAAKIVGTDPPTDIAVLQINADGLTELPFGNSETLRVGDYVVAIGNPFGLGQTVTSGIISALGRTGLNIEGYEDFIQTDASINPGNSGGALVNLNGELVGINTAILAPAGGNIGIGFAVPSNMARSVMEQLVRNGEVRRGRLGVTVQNVTPDIAESLSLPKAEGALVTSVEPGSAADRAGIRTGDVIQSINGRPIANASDLRNQIGLTPLGQRVTVELLRGGRTITVNPSVTTSRRS